MNKGNNKITEHRAIFQKSKLINQQTDKISQQPENCENCNQEEQTMQWRKQQEKTKQWSEKYYTENLELET